MPVLGTCLVIGAGGEDRWGGRLLSARPLVLVGLISYSLYLWHQPAFAFARLAHTTALSTAACVWLIAGSTALSVISWRAIETPFRRRERVGHRALWLSVGTALVALTAAGVVLSRSDGFPQRLPQAARGLLAAADGPDERFLRRDGRSCYGRSPGRACVLGAGGVAPTWALLGDSHAATLAPELDRRLADRGVAGLDFTQTGCPVAPGLWRSSRGKTVRCYRKVDPALDRVLATPAIRDVVVLARYPLYATGRRYDNGEGGVEPGTPVVLGRRGDRDRAIAPDELATLTRDTLERLLDAGKRVWLVDPVPEVGFDVPRYAIRRAALGATPVTTSAAAYRARAADTLALFDSLGDRPGLKRVRVGELFCGPQRCLVSDGQTLLYFDDNHLSRAGAARVVDQILLR